MCIYLSKSGDTQVSSIDLFTLHLNDVSCEVLMAYLGTLDDTLLKQSSILELGSGCGAVGMYAALRGQKGGGDIGKPVCLMCPPCHALILWKCVKDK